MRDTQLKLVLLCSICCGMVATQATADPYISRAKIQEPNQLSKLRREADKDPYRMHELATAYYNVSNITEARRLWDIAAKRDQNLPNADVQIVSILLQRGKLQAAEVALDRVRKSRPDNPHTLISQGDLMLRKGKVVEARSFFEKAREVAPDLPAATLPLGRFLELTGDYKGAKELYRQATKIDPKRPEGWVALASLDFKLADVPASLESFRQAERVSPGRIAEASLGELYYSRKAHVDAYRWFKAAVAKAPSELSYLVRLGQVESLLKVGELGRANFRRALKLKADYSPALLAMGILEDNAGNWSQSVDYYRQVLANDPKNLAALKNLAMVLVKQDKSLDEAKKLIDAAWRAQPRDRGILGVYGCVLAELGTDDDHALEALSLAIQTIPGDPWLRYSYGKVLQRTKNFDESMSQLENCLILAPDFERMEDASKLIKSITERPLQENAALSRN